VLRVRRRAEAGDRAAVDRAVEGEEVGLCGYTRALCYSSLAFFFVNIRVLHIKEIGEGELQKALV
jgi:hypothetical protein